MRPKPAKELATRTPDQRCRAATHKAEVRGFSAKQRREKLESISERVEKIEADMKPLGKTVATMEPIVADYAVTRWKIAGAFALGTTLITAFGWVISLFAAKIAGWVFGQFR